jgi:hypothetical protein
MLSEGERAKARQADERVALLAEAVPSVGQPCERVLNLDDLLSPPIHQGHLDLRVEGLRAVDDVRALIPRTRVHATALEEILQGLSFLTASDTSGEVQNQEDDDDQAQPPLG